MHQRYQILIPPIMLEALPSHDPHFLRLLTIALTFLELLRCLSVTLHSDVIDFRMRDPIFFEAFGCVGFQHFRLTRSNQGALGLVNLCE